MLARAKYDASSARAQYLRTGRWERSGAMRDGQSVPQLPGVLSGQIWLVEHDAGMPLSLVDRAVLAAANVVLYDRALASLVAQLLPLGAYAEPLPGVEPATGPAITPR